LASTPTAPSKAKQSQPDEIVELQPPAEFGFSGTVKFYRFAQAETISLLKSRGYVVVNQNGDAA
jgi:hypothetical protein